MFQSPSPSPHPPAPWSPEHGPLHFSSVRTLLRTRKISLADLVGAIFHRIKQVGDAPIFISLAEEGTIAARIRELEAAAQVRGMHAYPLFGVPFAVKDNIDVAGIPTTAACRDFAYTPAKSSPVVEALEVAGAVFIGKTNLDQFATGLTGLLSSYGPLRNSFNPEYICGGSSSGSAAAVALGLVSFAVGTDTAGSGRVPAAFNNLVGLKPTRGVLSTRGLVPACRSLDCLSFLTLNVDDAAELLTLTKGFDSHDPYSRRAANELDLTAIQLHYSRFRFGVPRADQLDFFGDQDAENLYQQSLGRLEQLGGQRVEVDISAFLDAGRLLYEGPWVAERFSAVEAFHAGHQESIHPVTRAVMERGREVTAVAAFQGQHTLETLRRRAEAQWALMDVLVLPTTGTILTIAEASADPAAASTKLGRYTNFVNLLDLCALALPAGFLPAPRSTPFGITLIAPAFSEANLLALGERFFPNKCGGLYGLTVNDPPPGKLESVIPHTLESEMPRRTLLAVVGAHLSGQPLNYQLTELGGQLVRRTRTTPHYRLFALAGTTPPKPGLVRVGAAASRDGKVSSNGDAGAAITVEVWSMPDPAVATFLSRVPVPLTLGNVQMENGEWVKGFLCESYALEGANDISQHGGWLAYLKQLA